MSLGGHPPSVPFFAFAQGMLSLFSSFITGLFLLFKADFAWKGIGISLVNSFLIAFLAGLVTGSLYNALLRPAEGQQIIAKVLTTLILLLTLGIGLGITVLTYKQGGAVIWTWTQ